MEIKMNLLKNIKLVALLVAFIASTSFASTIVGNEEVDKDIIAIATEAGSFSTLATALKEANLIQALQSEGPFTVFAPTDEAFAKLPEGTIENLLKDKDALTEILMYHVVSGNFSSKDVAQYSSAKTLSNNVFNIEAKDDHILIDNAKVITADVKASNGTIHIIDSVLIPESK
jgi:uncharacterized surface protein with fasciclin (FAS1) repeats